MFAGRLVPRRAASAPEFVHRKKPLFVRAGHASLAELAGGAPGLCATRERKMDMFATVILVCAAALPQRDCNRDTAVDVVAGPAASSPLGCGFGGQAMLASTALG